MKSLMFAAALCVGTAALAQSGATSQSGTSTRNEWGQTGSQAQGTPVGQTNANPMGTSNGTSAMGSDWNGQQNGTATTGTGMTGTGNAGAYTGMGGPAPGAADYPPCSRSIRDHCTQTYERGIRRHRARR